MNAKQGWKQVVVVAAVVALAGCSAVEEAHTPAQPDDVDPNASAADLYFEVLELRTDGLMPEGRFAAIEEELADAVDEQASRRVLVAPLQRTYDELRRGADAEVFAGHEGRAYARRLNRAGIRAAEQYSERVVLVAGFLGIPTSKTDAVLMLAIPVGGVVVVKVSKIGLKGAAFLLRHFREADSVIEDARRLGFATAYAADAEALRRIAGDSAVDAIEHVGASARRPLREKLNPWNPAKRSDNCTACVASVIRASVDGYLDHSASDLEKIFGYVGRERQLGVDKSIDYIEKASGLRAMRETVELGSGSAPIGHYAIMTRWSGETYRHVVYGRVMPTGRIGIFDPQTNTRMTYEVFLREYGQPHRAFLFTEAP